MTTYVTPIPGAPASARISAVAASPPAQAAEARNPSVGGSSRPNQQNTPADSVTILNKIQDTKREARKEDSNRAGSTRARAMHNVQFAYNYKGDLRIRFTDSSSKLIYQTPPVHFTMMSDMMARSQSWVNTRV